MSGEPRSSRRGSRPRRQRTRTSARRHRRVRIDGARLFLGAIGLTTLAALSAFLALFLAWHHPLAPGVAFLAAAGVAVATALSPKVWPFIVLPALPLAGLAPWTGWQAVEEFDLLLLAVAAGGCGRLAWDQVQAETEPAPGYSAATAWLWPVLLCTLLALWTGLQAAGGDSFGWWQGRGDPADRLRLAKGVLGACLLLPLLRAGWRDDPAGTTTRLTQAFSAMLLVAGLAVLWERLAYGLGGLLDVAGDVPAGRLFWGVQAGPAALPVLLAVGMPFAAAAWAHAPRPRDAVLPVLALALGAHACVVSFSAAAYLAVPLALVIYLLLAPSSAPQPQSRGRPAPGPSRAGRALAAAWAGRPPRPPAPWPNSQHSQLSQFGQLSQFEPLPPRAAVVSPAHAVGLWPGLPLALGFAVLALLVTPGSGWRGLAALLGAAAWVLPLQALGSRLPTRSLVLAMATGGLLGLLVLGWAMSAHDDGALAVYAGAWAAAALALGVAYVQGRPAAVLLALAAAVAVMLALPAVAWRSGGAAALGPALIAAAVLLLALAWSTLRRQPGWPDSLSWQSGLVAMLAITALLAAVLVRTPWPDRLQQWARHGQAWQLQWLQGLQALQGPGDWLLGRGLGRSADLGMAPPALAASAPGSEVPPAGDLRLQRHTDGWLVELPGAAPVPGLGLPWRLSQQVALPEPGPAAVATVQVVLRLAAPAEAASAAAAALDSAAGGPAAAVAAAAAEPVAEPPASLAAPPAEPAPRVLSPADAATGPRLVAEVCAGLSGPRRLCASATQRLAVAGDGAWQTLTLPLQGPLPPAGGWSALRPTGLALALDAPGLRLDIDSVSLVDGRGAELLRNGSFDAGLAHWHLARESPGLPVASTPLQLLVDQGLLGLLAWAGAAGWALWRLTLGAARRRRLAAPLAGAGAGLALVAAGHGLFDVPRLAFLLAAWLALALTVPGRRRPPRVPRPAPHPPAPTWPAGDGPRNNTAAAKA